MLKRQIKHEMVVYLDQQLRKNGLAHEALKNSDANMLMVLAAMSCVGIREEGHNSGPIIELIQSTIGKAEKESYCLGFIQTCVAYAEGKTNMRSLILPTEHVMTCWEKSPPTIRVPDIPSIGDIAVYNYEGTINGHAEIVLSTDNGRFKAIGANTAGGVNEHGEVIRDGDGIYYTDRSLNPKGTMKLVGFMRPF